jgi:hypothetical protein
VHLTPIDIEHIFNIIAKKLKKTHTHTRGWREKVRRPFIASAAASRLVVFSRMLLLVIAHYGMEKENSSLLLLLLEKVNKAK